MTEIVLTKDEVILLQLTRANLLLESVAAQINIGKQTFLIENLLDLAGVVIDSRHDGDNEDLARAKPEWPFSGKVLREDTKHAFHAAKNGTVNHDGAGVAVWQFWVVLVALGDLLILAGQIAQLEALRQGKIKLNRAALVVSAQRIIDSNVDLGAVERAITGVKLPSSADLGGEVVQRLFELRLSCIPQRELANKLLRAGGELEFEGEAEQTVDGVEEVKGTLDLLTDLREGTEDVGVILLESTDTGKAGKCAGELVTVENAKVGHPPGEITEVDVLVGEDLAVTGAVHGL